MQINPVLTEVESDDANVQLPTEATQEWVANPGGGFTPGGTGAGGKVHKAALRRGVARAQPYTLDGHSMMHATASVPWWVSWASASKRCWQ